MIAWPVTISLPHGLIVSGITTWAVQMAEGLVERGTTARLVAHNALASHEELGQLATALPPGVEIITAPDITDPDGWRESLRIYRDLMPMILLPNILAEDYAVAATLALTHPERIRVVAWNHLDNPYDYAHLSYYEPIIHRFVAMSRRCETRLREHMPSRASDIVSFPYGVHLPSVQARKPIEDCEIRLAYGGRMDQNHKRVFELIDIAVALDLRGVRFHMRLIGDGPQTSEMIARAHKAMAGFENRSNNIEIVPPVPYDEMSSVWSWADVSLLLSNKEGFSISTMESMAHGCVPILSRCESGVGDLIEEGNNGFTCPIGDTGTVVAHVALLAAQPSLLAAMSRAARQTAKTQCSTTRFVSHVSSVLADAAASPNRPWPSACPLQMDASDGVRSATVPHDAASRLRLVLARIAKADAGPVAIYGAGKHTRALAGALADSPVEIVAVLEDDFSLIGGHLWGWPIVAPESVREIGVQTVVISSWLHESDIAQRRGDFFKSAGIQVAGLYSNRPDFNEQAKVKHRAEGGK